MGKKSGRTFENQGRKLRTRGGALAACMFSSVAVGACGAKVSMGTGSAGSDAGGTAGAQAMGGRGNGGKYETGGSGPLAGGASGALASYGGQKGLGGGFASFGGQNGLGGSLASGGVGGLPPSEDFPGDPITKSTKLDLLLVIDNSISMATKQQLFYEALADTLRRLVNPPCVSASKSVSVPLGEACPTGTARESTPLTDVHVGVISTSLGAHGGDICLDPASDDKARLIPSVRGGDSYQGLGFTKWDAAAVGMPSGLANVDTFVTEVEAAVRSVGETGCGFEAQLESWYRFLIDPEPPLLVGRTADGNETGVEGIDGELLAQRTAFLRPDSAVAIALLTDENDCSIMDSGQGWLVGLQALNGATFRFPRATSVCATNPNDPCCRSCASVDANAGCLPANQDPNCTLPTYTAAEDHLNLRCADQKRRFGFELLYPVERYIAGLTSPWVLRRDGGWARNPLFTEFEGKSRRPSLVSFAAIVGVPWQDIATPASLSGSGLEFSTAAELSRAGRWNLVSKPPGAHDPLDPFMIESSDPRPSTARNPVTGEFIGSAESTNPTENFINGHEERNVDGSDLQKACIFELSDPIENCMGPACPCSPARAQSNSALCQSPDGSGSSTTQYYGAAYPGLRELEVLRGIGESAVVASACPKSAAVNDPDGGYFPALRALRMRLGQVLE